jgi:hypothetical protein
MPPRRIAHEPTPVPEISHEPEDEPVPEETPATLDQNSDALLGDSASLAEAILLMTAELRRRDRDSPSRSSGAINKVRKPDTFDGSDPRKLNNFILLCNLYFRNNPYYTLEEPKVTFALSYLSGTALEYFEPSILDSDEVPDWMDSWPAFVRILRNQFGPIDPTADAEDGIDNLKMKDNQRIVKYNVEFNRLSIQTGWDDSVLRHRYYSGLAERIKDIMGQQGKPATLEAMKTLAHSIDARHWERNREKSRSEKNKPDNSKSDNNQNSDKRKSDDSKKNKNKPENKEQSSSSGKSSALADKLGKDGKLTPTERQRRFDNNLCMFCADPGHKACDCPKSTSSASKAKGRAAQVKEKEETPDPKKD